MMMRLRAQATDTIPAVAPGWSAVTTWVEAHPIVGPAIGVAIVLLVAWLANVIARRVILRGIARIVTRTHFTWDNQLHDHDVFKRLANIVPALITYYGVLVVPGLPDTVTLVIQRVAVALVVILIAVSAGAFLTAINDIYAERADARSRPIKGYLQIAKIVITILAGILVLSQLVGTSPVVFLSGIGALTAVILLIFRDTILSFVASIQISANDMVRLGDWIEVPELGADGDVVDIALHTVKVQNWDKTITTVPTHRLISDSFRNWRGMSESGGRRIKRAINIDMTSVRFLDDEQIEELGRWELLSDYIAQKLVEIEEHNGKSELAPAMIPHVRRLTNLGTFRAYVVNYLRAHPHTHDQLTLMVRQLEPSSRGVPIEIYVFTNDTAWVAYEGIQSDIIDHLLCVLPDFGLRVFQDPAGTDLRALAEAGAGNGRGGRPDSAGESP
ncbi:MAG TPA: mechanosensitive ion channel family protein [Longimicrobiales bacterium]|nr:mechanosensitive ion channel family protein [Longimicrobiales bacterium]